MCARGRSTTEMHRKGIKEARQPEDHLQHNPEEEVLRTVSKETVSCCLLPTVFEEAAYSIHGL